MHFILILFLLLFGSLPLQAKPLLSDLSLEEKIGQLLIVHFQGEVANEEARRLIQEIHVGGFIYYTWANGLINPQQIQTLSAGLQALASIPLFIGIDQEGGRVNRLQQGFTPFPGNWALAQARNKTAALKSAQILGKELKEVGINLNFAPVVDVNSNPLNPVIGTRAFGCDPFTVAYWGKWVLQGFHQAGLLTTLKHFPGHGDASVDSHQVLPTIHKSRQELEQMELFPFWQLKDQTDFIMTGHLFVPALDPTCCVTFSYPIVHTLLRQEKGFSGLIITDSLVMQSVLDLAESIQEVACRSFEAGHDLLLLGGKQLLNPKISKELIFEDIRAVHQALVQAVRQGRLSEERLNESVERILILKERYLK